MEKIDRHIKLFFENGFNNKEIMMLLAHSARLIISISTLKKKLKKMGLFRRKHHSSMLEVALFILKEQEGAGSLHGYRWMHTKCLHAGFKVPRDTVYQLMKVLDPNGIKCRLRRRLKRRQYSSPGPNFVWHVDSYDKLKPYGIAINGCIDGYSRYVVWLEAYVTNNDPKVIASYFIYGVQHNGGCPRRVRADLGTENGHIETMQTFLRRQHEDEFAGDKSFLAGKSTHNQRIEWFWGIVRKEMGQFYMDLFQEFCKDGTDLFCGALLDKNLIQFCFMDIIQENLNELRDTWNLHILQSNPDGLGNGKRPIMMYTVPELYNAEDYLCEVNEEEIRVCREETTPKSKKCADDTVSELCELFLEENRISEPSNVKEATELYMLV